MQPQAPCCNDKTGSGKSDHFTAQHEQGSEKSDHFTGLLAGAAGQEYKDFCPGHGPGPSTKSTRLRYDSQGQFPILSPLTYNSQEPPLIAKKIPGIMARRWLPTEESDDAMSMFGKRLSAPSRR